MDSLIGLLKQEDHLVNAYNENETYIQKYKRKIKDSNTAKPEKDVLAIQIDLLAKENENLLPGIKELRKKIRTRFNKL